jgi:DNA-binding response OmpR family regulator
MRILIVEDEGLIALDMESVLIDAGCDVVGIAGSVKKALKILDEKGCDAAILDANLGNEDTTPIAEALRARQIPFLIVSGYERPRIAGNMPFLSKPYAPAALVSAVERLTKVHDKVA